jgi:DNA-binding transcriptional regulator GbsR (MarR family)
MKLEEARRTFVDEWGKLGAAWGINRTMAQIHALLLAHAEPMDTDEIMEQLIISRGNANMNLRALMEWGLVVKLVRPGVRREFYAAEKDVWKMARAVAAQRRRRELEPLMRVLEDVSEISPGTDDDLAEVREFRRTMREIQGFGAKAGKVLDLMQRIDQSSFLTRLMGLLKAG